MLKTVLFLQSRLNSQRFPNKALAILGGKPSLQLAMHHLFGAAEKHVLLTSETSKALLAPLAKAEHFACFVGPEDDVLARFFLASEQFDSQWIFRATGDNSIIEALLAHKLLEIAEKNNADYVRFIDTPHGSGLELFKTTALYYAYHHATTTFDREHVTPYIYNNTQLFKVLLPLAPKNWLAPHICSTFDTAEDYNYLNLFYNTCYNGDSISIEEFIKWATLNPHLPPS